MNHKGWRATCMVGVIGVVGAMSAGAAWAQTVSVQGQFLAANLESSRFSEQKFQLFVDESLETMTASLVLRPLDGAPVMSWESMTRLSSIFALAPRTVLIDGVERQVAVDTADWRLTLEGQVLDKPQDAQFQYSYGNAQLEVSFATGQMTMQDPAVPPVLQQRLSGPGAHVLSYAPLVRPELLNDDGSLYDWIAREDTLLATQMLTQLSVSAPQYAIPASTTCVSVSCMGSAPAPYQLQEIRLSYQLVSLPVPEVSTASMMVLGLLAVAGLARRRRGQ